jgi:hypothetical protein
LKKRLSATLSVGILAVATCARLSHTRATAESSMAQDATASAQTAAKYVGVETCKECHGKNEPTANKRGTSNQMEFKTWSGSDEHSKAFSVLMEPKTEQIARHLGMKTLPKDWPNPEEPPEEWNRCLSCHSMNFIDKPRRGQRFKLSDGVSCDGCHGPAELWLGPHQEREYSESLKLGMTDIRNPVVRAEMCLSCHLGNRVEGKIVDHEMYAAGHPPLVFEVNAYSQKNPPHWQPKKPDEEHARQMKLWSAGQLVGLREAVRLLAEDMRSDRWPEYAHFDCASCHHDLRDSDWRKSSPPRTWPPHSVNIAPPGRPIWQPSQTQYWTCGMAWLLSGDDSNSELFRQLTTLERHFFAWPFGHSEVTAAFADEVFAQLDELIAKVKASDKSVQPDKARDAALKLCDLAELFAWRGPAAARETAFALQTLIGPILPADSSAAKELTELATELDGPAAASRYDPREFTRRIGVIRQQIPSP